MDPLETPPLRTLEPPAGGLTRLRARLDAEDRRARRWWLVAVPAVAALAAAILLLLRAGSPPTPVAVRGPAPLADATMSTRPDVQFYWVASSPVGARAAAAPALAPVVVLDPAVGIAP